MRKQIHEIVDRRTGEEWKHVALTRSGFLWKSTVRNLTTGQEVQHTSQHARLAFYDALVTAGAPRDVATAAAKTLDAW